MANSRRKTYETLSDDLSRGDEANVTDEDMSSEDNGLMMRMQGRGQIVKRVMMGSACGEQIMTTGAQNRS
jgi:hypothetical protein